MELDLMDNSLANNKKISSALKPYFSTTKDDKST